MIDAVDTADDVARVLRAARRPRFGFRAFARSVRGR